MFKHYRSPHKQNQSRLLSRLCNGDLLTSVNPNKVVCCYSYAEGFVFFFKTSSPKGTVYQRLSQQFESNTWIRFCVLLRVSEVLAGAVVIPGILSVNDLGGEPFFCRPQHILSRGRATVSGSFSWLSLGSHLSGFNVTSWHWSGCWMDYNTGYDHITLTTWMVCHWWSILCHTFRIIFIYIR